MFKTKADKIISALVITSVIVIGVAGKTDEYLQSPPPKVKAQTTFNYSPIGKPASLAWPALGQSAIGAEGYTVLETNGVQTPVPIASIAKLITALAVLKVKPLSIGAQSPSLRIGQADIDLYNSYRAAGGSVVAVTNGEDIGEYQVLQAMMLPSANNLADSLAVWAYGSLKNYIVAANKMLASYGLKNTHVSDDASGLSPNTTSSASDLVKLGEIALANPVLADVVSQSNATLPFVGLVKNVNSLIGTQGINGIKTGNSDQAGGNYLFSSEYSLSGRDILIIGAVLKSTDLSKAMNDSLPLLISAQGNFKLTPIASIGQVVAFYKLPWGRSITASSSEVVRALTWNGKALDKPELILADVTAPLAKGTVIGTLSIGNLEKSNIILDESVTKPSAWWRLTHW
jgi:D-alanyl-D-alanine carboxypeptidase (penicillin-binding protein 5/6)